MAVVNLSKTEQDKLLKEKPLEEIKEVYRPLARAVVEKYSKYPNQEKLVELALETVEFARQKYLENGGERKDYKFDTYLTYFFKTAIEKFLDKQNTP
ncbi:hypothetical protein L6258_00705 [Candidatus Parcubacteria bacterium]|nr:hypothetical protein [Candidatus Parcubacteria bacterium]